MEETRGNTLLIFELKKITADKIDAIERSEIRKSNIVKKGSTL